MTRFGAYLVLFSMEWLVKEGPRREESLSFLRFWLNSIVVHARDRRDQSLPPIVFVGTHKDKVIIVCKEFGKKPALCFESTYKRCTGV
jgi:hypothetical protein